MPTSAPVKRLEQDDILFSYRPKVGVPQVGTGRTCSGSSWCLRRISSPHREMAMFQKRLRKEEAMVRKYNIEGVQFEDTGHKIFNYDASDIETLFRQRDWRGWDDLVHWLRDEGVGHGELSPARVVAMADDLSRLKEEGVPFTADPQQVFALAHHHRNDS